MRKIEDLTGQLFGRLTVKKFHGQSKHRDSLWECVCTCGEITVVYKSALTSGRTKSCGCWGNEIRRLPFGRAARNVLLGRYQRNAKARNKLWALTEEQFDLLVSGSCHYCGVLPTQKAADHNSRVYGEFYYNGIDRKENSLGYTGSNSVSCCGRCNDAKGTMSEKEFLVLVDRVHRYQNQRQTLTSLDRAATAA